jgi:hypothetical protein
VEPDGLPASEPPVPVVVPDSGFDAPFLALPVLAALCFFVVLVSVLVVVDVSPAAEDPAPIEFVDPEEPLPLVDFEDFACFLWCFFACVPVADEVSLLVEAEPGVALPVSLVEEPEPMLLPVSLVEDPEPMLLPEPDPMLLPGCC